MVESENGQRGPHLLSRGHHNGETLQESQPFLKWPGGKRWLWKTIKPLLPPEFRRYFEPFVGGGAIFFALQPKRAILSDVNFDLINAYKQVRDNVEDVIDGLEHLAVNSRTYQQIRKNEPKDNVARAIRFIYLSKTAFNGMYRVNRQGHFNVPFAGELDRKLFDPEALRAASLQLKGCRLLTRRFAESITDAKEGDLVYCDPPYTVLHNNNGFLRYNEKLFSWSDQEHLAALAQAASGRGVTVLVSNARTKHVRALYSSFRAVTVYRPSCISAQRQSRRQVSEFLFVSRM